VARGEGGAGDSREQDELTKLLEHASPEPASRRALAAPDESLPEQLSMTEVRRGLGAVQPRIDACFAQAGARGAVVVALMLAPDGRVHEAHTTGPLAGSAHGECLERAVRTATFPRFRGGAMSLSYAFLPRAR
jgi:hypothetical protein